MNRWRIIAAALMAAVLLAGCGTLPLRLGYGNGPRLLYWWLDGYVDLTETQAAQAREAIGGWFRWHRQSQLPRYADVLAQVKGSLHEPVTPQALCAMWEDVRDYGDTALEHAMPAIASFVGTLSHQQLENIEHRFEKVNREFREEHLHPDPAQRRQAAQKRVRERAEMLYGPLEPAQLELLSRAQAASPFDARLWEAERLLRQQDILATLRKLLAEQERPPGHAQAVLDDLARRLQTSPREHYRHYKARLTAHNCSVAAQLHNSASAEQREHARQRLQAWEEDLRELAGQVAGRSARQGAG